MELQIDYICALTNLYGHVSPKQVWEVYNQQNEPRINLSDIERYLKNLESKVENRYIYVHQGEFLEEIFYLFEERFEELLEKQVGKPHYIPKKLELLKYADLNYWEKPAEYKELEEYVQMNYFSENQTLGEKICDEIFDHIRMNNMKEAMRTFEQYEVIFENEEESDPVLYILQRLSNNTRMQMNNGHTLIELSEITGEPTYHLPNKLPADDEDCHCGSKKQYKNCHLDSDEKIKRLNDYRAKKVQEK